MSATQEQAKGHRALLDVESRFNAKSHGVVLGIQGSQIQALANFVEIFDQYPYPVIINAAILKLADWFRVSNNVIKFYVYRVFKQASKQHLTKVINVEETVRRVMPVLGSNDPIARSIGLRILGCMSMIIADKIEIHYAVLQQLESATDRTEMEAAIWAADRICARSIRFAPVIFPRIEEKLKDDTLPGDTKLRLVQLFRHMHQDIGLTRLAKKSCIDMLDNPELDEKLTVVTLRTLSILLKEALLDRKEHIGLLFKYGLNDPRESVSSAALYDLVLLAQNDISLDPQHIHQLLQLVTTETSSVRSTRKRYTCARKVLWSYREIVGHMMRETWAMTGVAFENAIRVCEKRLLESISKGDTASVIAYTRFIVTLAEIGKPASPLSQQDIMVQTLSDAALRFSGYLKALDLEKIIDGDHISQVLKLEAHLMALIDGFDGNETFLETFNQMMNTREAVACRLPAFLSSISRRCQGILEWFPDKALLSLKSCSDRPILFVNIVKLLFRTSKSNVSIIKMNSGKLMALLHGFGEWNNMQQIYTKNKWYLYQVAQEAGCCGWYSVMQQITQDLSRTVETESSRYWLRSLSNFGLAEVTLAESTLDQAHKITNTYIESLIQFRAFRALVGTKVFGIWFIQLRMELFSAIDQMHGRLNPVVSYTISERKKQKMLIISANSFRELASRYDFLHRSYYGLDQTTLAILDSLKTCALVYEYAIHVFVGTSARIDPTLIRMLDTKKPWNHDPNSGAALFGICKDFLRTAINWGDAIDDRIGFELKATMEIQAFNKCVLSCPLSLPLFFFHGRTKVNVQLITDPRLGAQTTRTVQKNEDLVMKFEGFVQSEDGTDISGCFSKAFIVCSLTRENPRHFHDQLGIDMILSDPPEMVQQKPNGITFLQPPITFSADIMNNYFICKGLLHLPTLVSLEGSSGVPATQQQEGWLNVFVNIIDHDSNVWSMGPYHSGKFVWS